MYAASAARTPTLFPDFSRSERSENQEIPCSSTTRAFEQFRNRCGQQSKSFPLPGTVVQSNGPHGMGLRCRWTGWEL